MVIVFFTHPRCCWGLCVFESLSFGFEFAPVAVLHLDGEVSFFFNVFIIFPSSLIIFFWVLENPCINLLLADGRKFSVEHLR